MTTSGVLHRHRGGNNITAVTGSTRASNGLSSSRAFDRWYRYPAGFSPSSLDLAVRAAECEPGSIVSDPFAGAASVGTATIALQGTFIGLEAHPEIAELANLKFERRGFADGLLAAAEGVAQDSRAMPIESEHELTRRCFGAEVLAQLVGLRTEIARAEARWRPYLKWALLATLRDVAAVKVGWPYQRPALERAAPHRDPTRRFLQRATWMAEDLAASPPPLGSRVVAGDSRESGSWTQAFGEQRGTACVASPPYLNNFDYADATRLELYFWGVAASWKEMCDSVRSGMLIATTQQTRQGIARSALERLKEFPTLNAQLEPLAKALEVERARRERKGKEYDRVIGPYFVGLAGVLSNLYEFLEAGSRCAWLVGDSAPYGIYIDTPKLISSLAADLGFDPLEDEKVRTRGQRWRTNGVRHQVELSERLIVFRRP